MKNTFDFFVPRSTISRDIFRLKNNAQKTRYDRHFDPAQACLRQF